MTSDLRLRAAPGRGERQATGGSPQPSAFGSPESVEPFDDAESVDAVELPNAAESVIEVEPHNCFACGSLNEHGLHLDLHVATDRCWTELVLTEAFQGWDGIAHGGIVTTILVHAYRLAIKFEITGVATP